MMSAKQSKRLGLPWLWLCPMLLASGFAMAAEFDSDDWRIVTPQELAMKSEPRAPGAAAVFLYRQLDRVDLNSSDRVYEQIKILSEEGRGRADVELQFDKSGGESIAYIEARVVQPDGSIVPFKGNVYERPVVSGRDVKLFAKTFTLPEARVGSVVEYRYRRKQRSDRLYNTRWILSQDLFTSLSRYSIVFYEHGNARWSYPNGLPKGASEPVLKKGKLSLELRDVPAFMTERYMPPADEARFLVDFQYVEEDNMETDPAKFWKKVGKRSHRSIDRFADESAPVRKALAGIIAEGDSPAQKVRKIYDHVQQLRNTSYEPQLDEQEAERRDDHDASSAKDVAKNGYGDRWDLLAYFLALVRTAGIPAEPVLVASRSSNFFNETILDSRQLGFNVVAVNLDGKDVMLDPGTPFLPYGELHWSDTAVRGFKLNSDGGEWISMPLPQPGDALTARKAKLAMNEDGELEGTVSISYSGREALWRRLREKNDDEQSRREFLESDLKEQLAPQAEIKLLGQPQWQGRDEPLRVEYHVKLPQWAVVTGNRMLVGAGIFGGQEKGLFVPETRQHPIYYTYPWRSDDEIEITPPAGYKVPAAPETRPIAQEGGLAYAVSVEPRGGALVMRRKLTVATLVSRRETYPKFRSFYESVRAGDEQQAVLSR